MAYGSDRMKPVSEQSNEAMDMKQLESRLSDSKSRAYEELTSPHRSSTGP